MQSSSPLSLDAIRSTLATQALGHRIELRDQINSTNREAVALAHAGIEHGTVVVADSQTEGRGRLSRQWFSPPGINLYCSIVMRKSIDADRLTEWLSWLSLMTALAAAESIETVAAVQVAVKWPNDLLIAERKIGGILCESGTAIVFGPFQVIGIGLNVNGDRNDFPEDLRDTATTICHEAGHSLERNRLLAQFLYELEACVEEFEIRGSERIALAYRHRCSTIGKTVRSTLTDGKEFIGLAEGIEQDGALRVIQHPLPTDGRRPDIHHLRVADIVHLRT
jgi:BirA family transcriptional regulator, biotin operon repressor / biotin---[acetyl-CoA-carboxylase] ligase